MTILGIREYATLRNPDLVGRGVAPEDATRLREQFTGQRLRIGPVWAQTIGWWGGVQPLREIAELVEKPAAYVKTYARCRGLRYRTRNLQRTPAQLAVLAFATLPAPARDAARALGLFPAEMCLYRAAMSELLAEAEVPFAGALRWSPAELEARWRDSGLSVVPPLESRRPLDVGAVARAVEEQMLGGP